MRMTFGRYFTAVSIDDSFHIGKPNTRPGILAFTVETLEWLKDLVRLLRLKSNSVVSNAEEDALIGLPLRHFNRERLSLLCVFI